jgi:ketosteroid isomerase-like protein
MAIRNNTVTDVKHLGAPGPPEAYEGHDDAHLTIVVARDGKSAWASVEASIRMPRRGQDNVVSMRASNLLVATPNGWRIAALAWTEPTENDLANKDAKAGKLKAEPLEPEPGDASLREAFAKLTTDGATNVAKDIVAFGSGPNERTVGAAAFTKPWNAAWKGKTTIVSSVARVAPSGTTGWVAATVELQKKGYKIPFTVFAVFDKDAAGAWTLVHIHFTV